MIWIAWRTVPVFGFPLAAWVVLVVVTTWPRFPCQTLPGFLDSMRYLWRRR
jgi:hypothetical protein